MNPIFDLLSTGGGSGDAARLRQYGMEASASFLNGGEPLNSSIVKLAQEHDLNPDQIQRVVEYANNATHKHTFEKSSESKDVTFPLAKPHEILAKLGTKTKTAAPNHVPTAPRYIPGAPDDETFMADLFGEGEKFKLAHAAPYADVERAYFHFQGVLDKTLADEAQATTGLVGTKHKLAEVCRQSLLSGEADAHEIYDVINQAAETEGLAKRASDHVIVSLVNARVLKDATMGFEKTAHRSFNPDHPIAKLVVKWGELEKIATARHYAAEKLQMAVDGLRGRLIEEGR